MNFNKNNILIKNNITDINHVFLEIARFAHIKKYITDIQGLIDKFWKRENLTSTGFEDGFAIPHAVSKDIKEPHIIIFKSDAGINWKSLDNKKITVAIALLIPEEEKNTLHLDILSNLSRQLLKEDFRKILKTNDRQAISDQINAVIANISHSKVSQTQPIINDEKSLHIIGVSACTTGVAHTYMAKDRMETECLNKGYIGHWETQGSKGQEYTLTDKQIEEADVVIITADINVELDRFNGKKVFVTSTHEALENGPGLIDKALSEAKIYQNNSNANFIGNTKTKNQFLKHLLSGVSYMIPFVVFSGLLFAILGGIGHAIHGVSYDFSGNSVLDKMYQSAQVGFIFMIPVMAGFVANSIAGRAAIAPAMISAYVSTQSSFWYMYGKTFDVDHVNSLALLGALIFGVLAGIIVKRVNRIKVHRHLAPIMPIIIIPLFVTSILTLPLVMIGAPLGWLMYQFNHGLQVAGNINGVNFLIGFIIGAMIGFDLGGPINKIAVLAATGLMASNNFLLMGAAAAAIPIPPLGAGLATMIYRRKFKDDFGLGVSGLSLGFMGITEGSIPFAVKYTWRVMVPNVLASALAGGLAFALHIQGFVGAWGGPIITLFGGVGSKWTFIAGSGILTGTVLFYGVMIVATIFHAILFGTLADKEHFKLFSKKKLSTSETIEEIDVDDNLETDLQI